MYSLPATPGNSAQEQDNPSSSAATADVSNPQTHNNDTATHQGNQTPIVAASVATTAPTGWPIGGLWQGISGAGQWVLNNGVRPLATAAGQPQVPVSAAHLLWLTHVRWAVSMSWDSSAARV